MTPPNKMLRLLALSPWFPYPPDNGSRQRIFYLLRELSKTCEIRLVVGTQADSPPANPPELAAVCAEIVRVPWVWHDGARGGAGNALRALLLPTPRSVLETPNPALVVAIAAQLARPTDALLVCETGMDAYLPRDLPAGLPAVLEGAEISGLQRSLEGAPNARARLRAALTYRKGIRYGGRRMRRYRAITAASPGEADALRRAMESGAAAGAPIPPVVVVPNGVDVRAFPRRDAATVVPGRMIYNGALTYGPNRDAVGYFVRDILPHVVARVPEAHLLVTGRVPEGEGSLRELRDHPRVTLTGYLPDLKLTLAQTAVCVVPLLAGGGTRLKILEAWAAGVPVVATPIGADGLEGAVSGEHLFVSSDAPAFADTVIALLTQPVLAETMAQAAHTLAQARYDWERVGEPLADLLAELAAP